MSTQPEAQEFKGFPLLASRGRGDRARGVTRDLALMRRALNKWRANLSPDIIQAMVDTMHNLLSSEDDRVRLGACMTGVALLKTNISTVSETLKLLQFETDPNRAVNEEELGDEPVVLVVENQECGQKILEYGDRPIYVMKDEPGDDDNGENGDASCVDRRPDGPSDGGAAGGLQLDGAVTGAQAGRGPGVHPADVPGGAASLPWEDAGVGSQRDIGAARDSTDD